MADEKIGAGHGQAWLRQGGKEFAQVLPAFPQSVRVVEEPGLVGNPVPQEVFQEKGKDSAYQEWLEQRANEGFQRGQERDAGWER